MMNWIHDQNPLLNVEVLVQLTDTGHEVLTFYVDNDYGICAFYHEGYYYPKDILKWCLIT